MIDYILNNNSTIYIFAKDKNLKYIYCNEAIAEAAGMDSPHQMIGKTDYEVYWRKHAEVYRAGDTRVLLGHTHLHAQEIQTQPAKIATILTSKLLMRDENDNSCGITGHYIDITGFTVTKNNGNLDYKGRFWLGPEFSNEYLTKRELEIFKLILLGHTNEQISCVIKRSVKTVQSHVKSIVLKLQCDHQSQIVPVAAKYGLLYILDEVALQQTIK